jgi:hypothetical protein
MPPSAREAPVTIATLTDFAGHSFLLIATKRSHIDPPLLVLSSLREAERHDCENSPT